MVAFSVCADEEYMLPGLVVICSLAEALRPAARREPEDVAFWNTYALSADDQHLFHVRIGYALSAELVDITEVALDKLTLLHMHASQMQPVRSMYRPLRCASIQVTEMSRRWSTVHGATRDQTA